MTIREKIFTMGAVVFSIFVILALMNIWTHREVSSGLRIRDEVDEKLARMQEFAKWKNTLARTVSDIVASGHVPPLSEEQFHPPAGLRIAEHAPLAASGQRLVELIADKERASADFDRAFDAIRMQINSLYSKLDKEIATVLANAQLAQVLGSDSSEQSALAPYVLKSLNQLTLVTMNGLISMSFSEQDRSVVAKNRGFLSSQLQLIDTDGRIAALFDELFAQIESLERLILKSNETLSRFETRIEKAKQEYDLAVKRTDIDSVVRDVQSDLDHANEGLEEASRRSLATVVVCLFIVPFFVIAAGLFGLNTIIVGPITNLMDAMKHVEDGRFDARAPVRAQDEIGKLARAFNAMAAEIKAKVAEMSRLNQLLRESESSLRLTKFCFDNASVGIQLIDKDARILEVNPATVRMLGYSREELTAMTVPDIDPYITLEFRKTFWKNVRRQGGERFETVHRSRDGREFPVEINANLFEYENKDYAIIFVQDIAERKQDEEELHRLRNYLSNIINSMPSILVAVDPDGKVTQWNIQTERTTGLSFEEARAQPLVKVFPRLTDEMERVRKSIRERRVISSPKVSHKMAQETRFEDITIFPLVANGVEGAVIRVDDVTERVRMEEMMIQSEKMLTVGGLAAGMAHEINNPLAGMLQTAVVMANRLGTNLDIPASQKAAEAAGTTMEAIEGFMKARGILRMIDAIVASGHRVADIVDNMLSFARKSDSKVSPHHIEELLDKTAGLAATDYDLKKHYDFKRIEIRKEYAGDLPAVPCEGTKIQQVLLNVLRNGAQAMQEAGTESPRFVFRTRFEADRNMAVIEIEDNGPGMDEQTRKRIFEPFFTSKPAGVGTGLGLSVSFFIVTENHRGEMEVESRPGDGAKFIIRLPLARGITPT